MARVNSPVDAVPLRSRVRVFLKISYTWRQNLPCGKDIVRSGGNPIGIVIQAQVAKHHACRQNQTGGVRLTLASDWELGTKENNREPTV